MSNRISFRNIAVDRMYGQRFRGLALSKLSPHVNIVYGANASGKTTLAHAIQTVLLPNYARSGRVELDAAIRRGPDEMAVHVEGRRRRWELNGEPTSWTPALIRPESYHISLHDLLSAEAGDHSFAEEIIKEASGGYDVHSAGQELNFVQPTGRRDAKAKDVDKCRKALAKVRDEHKRLDSSRRELTRLRDELANARTAEHQVLLLEKARSHREALQAWQIARRGLEEFPTILGKEVGRTLDGALDLVDELNNEIARLDADLQRIIQEESTANAAIRQSNIPAEGLPDGLQAQLRTLVQELKDRQVHIARSTESLEGLKQEAKSSLRAIAGAADSGTELKLNFTGVQQLEDLTRRLGACKSNQDALAALERVLRVGDSDDLEQHADRLRKAQQYLLDWLREYRVSTSGLHRIRLVLWIGAAFSVTVATLTFLLGNAFVALGGLGVTATFVLLLLWIRTLARETGRSAQLQRQFQILGMEQPPSWTDEDVAALLETVLQKRAQISLKQEKQTQWSARAGERESVRSECAELSEQIRSFRQETGLDAGTDESFFYLVKKLMQHQDTVAKAAGVEGQRSEAQAAFDTLLEQFNSSVTRYYLDSATSTAEAEARLEALRTSDDKLHRSRQNRDSCVAQRRKLEEQTGRARSRRRKVFEDLGLRDGDTESLFALTRQGRRYQAQLKEVEKYHALLDDRSRELKETAGFSEELINMDMDALVAARDEQNRLADQKDALQKEVTTISTRIEDAERGHSLESAEARFQSSQAELAGQRDRDYAKVVGRVLVDALVQHTREQGLPEVFKRARDNFFAVTQGRYELRLGGSGVFTAFDTQRELDLPLHQLSSATRVQLLLCVRVAFIETKESEYCFPLTLDEALGNSDDDRAEMIIQTITTLAQKRQVIYFTAQQDEVHKWQKLAGKGQLHVATLGEAARVTTDSIEALPAPVSPPPPPPDGRSHADYGALLNIAPWSGRDPAGSLHLWYLVEDCETLYGLLSRNLHTWGPVAALMDTDLLRIDSRQKKRLRALGQAVEAWKAAWQIGRGRVVDRAALEASDAVSGVFIDRVADLNSKCAGDASTLLNRLRQGSVPNFYTGKLARLRDFFVAEGYLDLVPKSTKEEIRHAVFAAIAPRMAAAALEPADVDRVLERIRRAGQA